MEELGFEECVEETWEEAERSCEEEEGGEGACFGFEAFEEGSQSDDVEGVVEEVGVEEGIGV